MNKTAVNRCLKDIEMKGCDTLLVSDPINISYLSGFRHADGFLLLSRKNIIYFTNFIYLQEAKRIKTWEVVSAQYNFFEKIYQKICSLNLKNIGFEGKVLSFSGYSKLKKLLLKSHIKFVPLNNIVENQRMIKRKEEISCIKQAAQISLEAFKFIEEIFNDSMSEKALCLEVERFLKTKGDSQLAFEPIVAFGLNSSIPHYIPGPAKLRKEKFFLTDLGAKYCGYCADLTRVFFLDKMPRRLKNVYNIVRKAASLAVKKIKDGIRTDQVDRAAREFIEKKGFGKYFGHGLGHGLGLEVHEAPFLNRTNNSLLREGMVLTVEPAIYLPGEFGIRLENMVLVKKTKGELLSGDFDW